MSLRLKQFFLQVSWCFLAALFLGFLMSSPLLAQASMTAELSDQSTTVGDSVMLTLTINGSLDHDVELPTVDGLEFQPTGNSTSISIINGSMTRSLVMNVQITPMRAGSFKIPSFRAKSKGKDLATLPLVLEVVDGSKSGAGTQNPSSTPQSTSPSPSQQSPQNNSPEGSNRELVFVKRDVMGEDFYEGQAIASRVKIYHRMRMQIIPERPSSPDWRIVSRDQNRTYRETVNGVDYNVLEFIEVLIPLKHGTLELPKYGGRVTYNEPAKNLGTSRNIWDLFQRQLDMGREVSKSIESPTRSINILALPTSNSPEPSSDAVGNFDVKLQMSSKKLTSGESATLTVTIEGQGSLDRVIDPTLLNMDNLKVYPEQPQLVEEVTIDGDLSSRRTYRFAIVPLNADTKKLEFSPFKFFDPYQKKWRVIPIKVDDLTVVPSTKDATQTAPSPDTTNQPGPSSENRSDPKLDPSLQNGSQAQSQTQSMPLPNRPSFMDERPISFWQTWSVLTLLKLFGAASLLAVLVIALISSRGLRTKASRAKKPFFELSTFFDQHPLGDLDQSVTLDHAKLLVQSLRRMIATVSGRSEASSLTASEVGQILTGLSVPAEVSAAVEADVRTVEHGIYVGQSKHEKITLQKSDWMKLSKWEWMGVWFLALMGSFSGIASKSAWSAEENPSPKTASLESLTDAELKDVIQSYETEFAAGKATADTLFNLALARSKTGEDAEALAAWLASWQFAGGFDSSRRIYEEGLSYGLSKFGYAVSDLRLSAESLPKRWLARLAPAGFLDLMLGYLLVSFFWIILFCWWWLGFSESDRQSVKWFRLLVSGLTVWVVGIGVCLFLIYHNLGMWAAVIAEDQAKVFATSSDEDTAESFAGLRQGTPIYVEGDLFATRLKFTAQDGRTGYVDALDIRLFRDPRLL